MMDSFMAMSAHPNYSKPMFFVVAEMMMSIYFASMAAITAMAWFDHCSFAQFILNSLPGASLFFIAVVVVAMNLPDSFRMSCTKSVHGAATRCSLFINVFIGHNPNYQGIIEKAMKAAGIHKGDS